MFKFVSRLLLAVVILASGSVALARDSIETQPVKFAKGASSATMKGTLKGDHTLDYTVRARAGQTMSVKLQTKSTSLYFNVLPPGSETALFVGSTGGNEWTGALPADGEYRVRTYLYRAAARRGASAAYSMTIGVTGAPGAAATATNPRPFDAKVKGTPYHATGPVPCSMGTAPAGSAQCEMGVIRGKQGDAEVHVKPAGGLERVLKFSGNKVSTDGTIKSSKNGDVWNIEVNDYEHYQISDSVILGG